MRFIQGGRVNCDAGLGDDDGEGGSLGRMRRTGGTDQNKLLLLLLHRRRSCDAVHACRTCVGDDGVVLVLELLTGGSGIY